MKKKKKIFYDVTLLRKDIISKRVIELNITAEKFGKKCNVSRQIINRIENKQNVSIESLISVCTALKLDYRNYLIN